MAETIETSEYTSAQQRAFALKKEANTQATSDRVAGMVSKLIMQSFRPLTIDELKDDIGACCHAGGSRASDKGFLPMSVANYLE